MLNLSGSWEFRGVGTTAWMPAVVPGSNFTDLLRAGKIPDPFVGDNEGKMRWVIESSWEYRKRFKVSPGMLSRDSAVLVLDGLDTIAEIRLNGRLLAKTDNMFVQWRIDVRHFLRNGNNELVIIFSPPCSRAGLKRKQPHVSWPSEFSEPGGPFVRKAPCQYGWDWGPRLPVSGVWRPVRLECRNTARITQVHSRQEHGRGGVRLNVSVEVERWRKGPLSIVMTLTAPCGKVRQETAVINGKSAAAEFNIPSPAVWWPNGYGKQHLYHLETSLLGEEGECLDKDSKKLGIRRLELSRKKDRWGESFTFVVNGIPVFAKGANWIPADSFPERVDEERYRHLLSGARDANMNMLRVWGGGFYENDIFYELCDEMDLLVWQDFMFACSQYPGDRAFIENVRHEAVDNIRRLRHHPSIALWCGNNEMEAGMTEWNWSPPPESRKAYKKLFHQVLPECVRREDPDTAYWPSSPSSGNPRLKASAESHGDAHDWSVWHGRKPFTVYREHLPRFVSEFGFQSLPDPATFSSGIPAGERNMSSYLMDHRQRCVSGNEIITHFLSANFRMPSDFSSLSYTSQLLQAEAMRYGIEHWRRNRARVSGTIYWQLNDCWPCPSWSSVDYHGRWKALHYFAKRFYSPVLLSACEEGTRVRLHVTNDTASPFRGKMSWKLVMMGGRKLAGGAMRIVGRALADTPVADLDLAAHVSRAGARRAAVIFLLQDDKGRKVSGGTVFFVPSKHLELANPRIAVSIRLLRNRWEVALKAESLARFVEIAAGGRPRIWDDNYFDLVAGERRSVSCCRLPGENLATFRSKLVVRSLWNAGVVR